MVVWSATDVLQLFELRRVLERHAVESAFPLPATGDPLRAVHAALADMRAADGCGDDFERDNAHRRFHAAVVALAGHRQLVQPEPVAVEPAATPLD
ncbi:FCD domain-containing protein [Nocardia beijingensis]